jgi:outer membrane protein TolC
MIWGFEQRPSRSGALAAALAFVAGGAGCVFAGSTPLEATPAVAQQRRDTRVSQGGSLEALVEEAMRNSPVVQAARYRWESSEKAPVQAATLPDPEITLQEFTVGGPRTLGGYETSDFYYTGFGFSQDIPWPSKLRSRAAQADAQAEYARQTYEAARREAAEKTKESYFELFFLRKALELLGRTRAELEQVERITEERYRVGQGQEQDVSKAQLQMTAIREQIEMRRAEEAQRQAELRTILGRDARAPDIEVAEVEPSSSSLDSVKIGEIARAGSPDLKMARAMETRSVEALREARANYIPDFSLGYMYQKTGPGLRDYYMLTLGAKIPLYFWRRQTPAIEQAALDDRAAHADARAKELEVQSTAQSEAIAMRESSNLMTLYRDGLIPQAEATRAAALNSYRVGKVDFQTLLSAVTDVLALNQGYIRALADHEIAIAKIQQITGDAP